MYDVIVAGGGPVGSQVAYRLAGLGHSVAVIDRKADLDEPVCCTGIVSEECVNAFAIDENVIYRHASSGRVFSPSGKTVRLYRKSPQAAILNRPAFNVFMADRARREGARYLLRTSVTDLAVLPDSVEVTTSGGGAEERMAGRAVVIASGFSQELTGKAGLRRAGNLAAGAQAEVEAKGVDEVEVYLGARFAPGYFAWLVPTAPGKALAGLLARRTPRQRLKDFLSFLHAQGKISSEDVPISVSAVTLKPLDRTYADRLLVVGTAAGQVKPTTGGGIYYGLLCADLAAQTLDGALRRDELSRKSLSDYQHTWSAKLGDELSTGYWARKLYERLRDARIDHIFDIMSSSGTIEEILKRDDVSFDWHGRSIRHLLSYRTLAKLIRGL